MTDSATENFIKVANISAQALHFAYGQTPVLNNLSFQLHPGELLAIVGPNGCGKSTLLKLLMGALTPQQGQITLDNRSLSHWGRIGMARRVALVPQMAGLETAAGLGGAGFTVHQSVLMSRYAAHVAESGPLLRAAGGLGIFGFETPDDERLAREAMWATDTHHLADRPTETLSGGERQRVALARAFTQQTGVLLLDEPTSALDLYHQLELIAQLKEMTSAGRIVVLVTHDLNLAATCATRVMVMDQGKMVADGKPTAVLTPAVLEPVYHVNVHISGEGTLHFERRTK